MVFFNFIMAGEKSRPPRPLQKIPVGSQARRALNCLPKADELFIATELACESSKDDLPRLAECETPLISVFHFHFDVALFVDFL